MIAFLQHVDWGYYLALTIIAMGAIATLLLGAATLLTVIGTELAARRHRRADRRAETNRREVDRMRDAFLASAHADFMREHGAAYQAARERVAPIHREAAR